MIKIKHKEKQGEHIVAKGKLILIDPKLESDRWNVDKIKSMYDLRQPIIISETEKIEVGDYFLYTKYNIIGQATRNDSNPFCHKILAIPEHFSPKQLQDIINGKLKEGDEVYLSVQYDEETRRMPPHIRLLSYNEDKLGYQIRLTNNHINLIPVNKTESWDDIYERFLNDNIGSNHFVFWLKENYNPPTCKKR